MPQSDQVAYQCKRQELRLKEWRCHQQNGQPGYCAKLGVIPDRHTKPGKSGGRERHGHEGGIEKAAGERLSCIQDPEPGHDHDKAEHPCATSTHVYPRQNTAKDNS